MSKEKQVAFEKRIRQAVKEKGGRCLPGFGGVPRFIILLPGARVMFAETRHQEDGTYNAGMRTLWRSWITRMGFSVTTVWTEEGFKLLEQKMSKETKDTDEPDLWLDEGPDIACPACGFRCDDTYYLGEANYCPECGKRLVKPEYDWEVTT